MSVMVVHAQSSLTAVQERTFKPEDLTAYFKDHDLLFVEPRSNYLLRNEGFRFTWNPDDPTLNSKAMYLMLNQILSGIGKECRITTQADRLLLTTYDDGFGLMSLEGFTIECRPIKV